MTLLKSKKALAVAFFAMFSLVLMYMFLKENDLFILRQVQVVDNRLLLKKDIIKLADLELKQNIFKISIPVIKKRLLANSLIKDVKISRRLPGTIRIKVKENDLIATIYDKRMLALEINGGVIPTNTSTALYDLPVVTGARVFVDSTGYITPSKTLMTVLKILKAIRLMNINFYHGISEIHYSKNFGILIYLRQHTIPIIVGLDNYSEKLCNLSVTYDLLAARNELSNLAAIDARFQGQVVVRSD